MRSDGAVRTLLGAVALCWLLGSTGCGATQSGQTIETPPVPAVQRVDWGMPLSTTGTGEVATAGVGQFPAKFTFDVTAPPSCALDYVAYNTSANFTTTFPIGPSIIAFNQLYSTQGVAGGFCDEDGPNVYWAYFTAHTGANTEGKTTTSPVISYDGSKVAYVLQEVGLQIIQWKAGEGTATAPATPDHDISGMPWSACTSGSCIQTIPFDLGTTDTDSAPFYDYNHDVLYVGDDDGFLHKFTGVFNGTPTEDTTSPWPIHVDSGDTPISGPVFDYVSGNIYMGDSNGNLDYVMELGSTTGTCASGSPP